jgi:hypothetical protein
VRPPGSAPDIHNEVSPFIVDGSFSVTANSNSRLFDLKNNLSSRLRLGSALCSIFIQQDQICTVTQDSLVIRIYLILCARPVCRIPYSRNAHNQKTGKSNNFWEASKPKCPHTGPEPSRSREDKLFFKSKSRELELAVTLKLPSTMNGLTSSNIKHPQKRFI